MNAQVKSSELVELAGDCNSAARDQLLFDVTAFFCEHGSEPTKTEQNLFTDVVVDLLPMTSQPARADVCARLAGEPRTPKKLVQLLAYSDIPEIYEPFLKVSRALSVQALQNASENLSDEHRLVIAERETVVPPVTEALVDYGETKVVHQLADNDGAQFFNKTLAKMLRRSQHDEELRSRFKRRGNRLASFIGQLKSVIQTQLSADRAKFESEFDIGELDTYVEQVSQTEVKTVDTNAVLNTLRKQLQEGEIGVSDALSQLTDLELVDDINALIASRLQLPMKRVRTTFDQKDPAGFAMLCYALKIDRGTFKKIAKFRLIALGIDPSYVVQSVDTFRRVTKKDSDRFIDILKMGA